MPCSLASCRKRDEAHGCGCTLGNPVIVWLIKSTRANGAPERSRAKRSVSFACEFWHGCWVGRRVKCLSQEVPGIAGSDPITTQYSVAILAQSTHTNRGIQAHPCTLVWCSSAAMSLNGVFDDGAENSENDRHFIGYEPNANEESDSSLDEDLLEGAERASGFEEDIGGFGDFGTFGGGPPVGSGDSDDIRSRRSRASPTSARPGAATPGQGPVPPAGSAIPEFFDIGTGSAAPAADTEGHEMQLIMRLAKALELSRGGGSSENKFKLSKMPSATTERGLPSA